MIWIFLRCSASDFFYLFSEISTYFWVMHRYLFVVHKGLLKQITVLLRALKSQMIVILTYIQKIYCGSNYYLKVLGNSLRIVVIMELFAITVEGGPRK